MAPDDSAAKICLDYVLLQAALRQVLRQLMRQDLSDNDRKEYTAIRAQIERDMTEIEEPLLIEYLERKRRKREAVHEGAFIL